MVPAPGPRWRERHARLTAKSRLLSLPFTWWTAAALAAGGTIGKRPARSVLAPALEDGSAVKEKNAKRGFNHVKEEQFVSNLAHHSHASARARTCGDPE